jgi:hypothetical protein
MNSCGYTPYLTLEEALLIKSKIDATVEFAKNNDIVSLNDKCIAEVSGDFPIVTRSYTNLKRNTPTKIYVMLDKNTGYFKIGRSHNPKKREKTLQSEKPTIELLFSFDATEELEKELHVVFGDKRIRGEWFYLTEDDIFYIKEIGGL